MEEMELVVTKTLWIPIDKIIKEYGLDNPIDDDKIMAAVDDWTCGLDDCDYVLIGDDERIKIENNIKKVLTK